MGRTPVVRRSRLVGAGMAHVRVDGYLEPGREPTERRGLARRPGPGYRVGPHRVDSGFEYVGGEVHA